MTPRLLRVWIVCQEKITRKDLRQLGRRSATVGRHFDKVRDWVLHIGQAGNIHNWDELPYVRLRVSQKIQKKCLQAYMPML